MTRSAVDVQFRNQEALAARVDAVERDAPPAVQKPASTRNVHSSVRDLHLCGPST